MLGRIVWGEGRKAHFHEERIMDLPVLVLTIPCALRREKHVERYLSLLRERHVNRVLLPEGWEFWQSFRRQGLQIVNTGALRTALTPAWAVTSLQRKGLEPQQATLRLWGERENASMYTVARALCPMVRCLSIDVPGGSEIAQLLHAEFGMPVLPMRRGRADLDLAFAPDPQLSNCTVCLKECDVLPVEGGNMEILCVLWENGRIFTEDIAVKADFS